MSLIIDSVTYDLPLKVIGRKADNLYKFAERTEDGELHAELIGVYFNYELQVAQSSVNVADYDALFDKLTEPVVSHEITLPSTGSTPLTFNCYFSNVSDDAVVWKQDGTTYFRNLTFSVVAISPARVPA